MSRALEQAKAVVARGADTEARRRKRRRVNGVLVPLYRVATSFFVSLLGLAWVRTQELSGVSGIVAYFVSSVLASVLQSWLAARDHRAAGEDLLLLDFPAWGMLIAGTGGAESPFFWTPALRMVDVAGSRPQLFRAFAVLGVLTVVLGFVATDGVAVFFDPGALVRIAIVVFFSAYLLATKALAYDVWKSLSRSNSTMRALVTEFEAKNEELETMAEKAARLAETKGAFLATMSHEIRTPVNGILGTSELLLESNLDSDQAELAQTINVSADTLLALINDILDFSKLEANKVEFEEVSIELERWMRETLEMVRRGRPKDQVHISGWVDPELPSHILGDPVRLRQILLNLASNAVKFTEEGSVEVQIGRQGELLRLEVRDTGIGMRPEVVDKLFTPFTQADASTTRRFGGTGLGLAISKRLIDGMGGTVDVRSEVGAGSLFTVHLPLRVAYGSEDESREAPDFLPEQFDLRILVADDSSVNRMVARRMFAKLGCEVDLAANGREAIERIRATRYDVVFMDMQMPELDGLEATRQILSDQTVSPPAIVALSANAFAEDRQRCREVGMVDFVAKPVRILDLRTALARRSRTPSMPDEEAP